MIFKFCTEFQDTSRNAMLDKLEKYIKIKGAKISIEKRSTTLTQRIISRVIYYEDIPKRMFGLFSGNSSRIQHKVFDDITEIMTGHFPKSISF